MSTLDNLQSIPRARLPLRTRLRRWLGRVIPRSLTKGERDEIDAERKAKAHQHASQSQLLGEARQYAHSITETLIDLNICYRYKTKEMDWATGGLKAVSFERPFVLRDEAIYLKVDLRPGRRPRGVGVAQLSDPEVLKNLSINCGHKVLSKYGPEIGFWYIVEREYGVRGIPSHVKYDEILTLRPASADGLSLPVGVGENKKPIYRSLGTMYSMLLAGTIGGGKSNNLNVILCTLLRYNSPHRLRLMLVDLKGGVEFAFFRGVPHLLELPAAAFSMRRKKAVADTAEDDDVEFGEVETVAETPDVEMEGTRPAIIERREQVPGTLAWLIREGERRMQLLKDRRCKSIGQYNFQNRKSPMAHIVLVIDEWADVKLDKRVGTKSEEALINIASRFRAVGIHVILCTQVPNKDVVSIRIKNVLPAKLVFACPDQYASMLILGNAAAHGLEPAGRAIFDWGSTRHEVQTPFINNATVDSVVAQAIAGHFNDVETATHDVTDQEILEWALAENGGDLDYRKVHNQFRVRGLTQSQAKEICKSFDGQETVVGSSTYKVMPGVGSKPRRLIPLKESDENESGPAS